jgi:hypothetical protein
MTQSQSPSVDSNRKKPLSMVWIPPAFLMIEASGFLFSAATHVEDGVPVALASPAAQQPAGDKINPESQPPC